MKPDDIRKLAAKASRTARATIETAKTAQPAKPAATGKPAKAAAPAAVAPSAPTGRPALRVVSSRPVPPLKSKPRMPEAVQPRAGTIEPTPGRLVIPPGTAARVRARAVEKMRQKGEDLFKPYEPAPGVLPPGHKPQKLAMDAAPASISAVAWAGQSYVQPGWFQGMAFLGYPVLAEMSQRPEYRKMSERLATEMVRKWIRLTSTGDDPNTTERIEKINQRLLELKLREACGELVMKDGFFGRSHLYLDTGDTDDAKELLKPIGNGRNEISKGKISQKKPLQRLTTVEASWCYPASYDATDPLKPDWLRPQTWFVMGKEVHRSRLLPFIGREVPDLMKPAYAFGGLSLTQMAQRYVDNWVDTQQHINRLVANFSKNGIKTDMQQMLSPDGSAADGTDLFSRIDLYTAMSDNNGLMVLNEATEEFFQFNTPLGTLDALQSQAMEQMCLPTGMPIVIFFGQTPKGLNASSDGEIRTWEQWIEAYQKHFFGDKIQRIIDFVQLSEFGDVDESIGYEWQPLHSLTEKEMAEVNKTKADRDVALIGAGVVDPVEVRRNLKADASSGYNGIDAEDVPEGPDETGGEEDGGEGGGEQEAPEGGDRAILPFGADATATEVAEDVWAMDDAQFEESKHPRDADGKFTTGTGSGGAAAAKTKKEIIVSLLSKGTTPAEVMQATGWPSVSMPAQAAAAGMKLEKYKEGGVTKYKGTPMTDEEKAAFKQALKDKKAQVKAKAEGGTEKLDQQVAAGVEKLAIEGIKKLLQEKNPYSPSAWAKLTPGEQQAVLAKYETQAKAASEGTVNPEASASAAPKPLKTISGPGNMEANIYPNSDGKQFNVVYTDKDSGEKLPNVHIAPSLESAEKVANKALFGEKGPLTPEPVKPKGPAFTPSAAELQKAKSTYPLGAHILPLADPAAVKEFNEKFSGTNAPKTDAEAIKKIEAFKALKAQNDQKQAELQEQAKAEAAKQKAEQEKAAKEAAEKNKALMAELGINEQEAFGFGALAKMMGGSSENFVENFKAYEKEATKLGYPISGFQCALIKNYTDGGYKHINDSLRKGSWTEAQHVYVKMVNSAIQKMPRYTGTVNRGATLDATQQGQYVVGNVVEERAFTSTSQSTGFGGNTRFKITAIGKRASHIKKLSNYASEDEVLFCARTFFKVTKIEGKPGGQMTVHMEEMDD